MYHCFARGGGGGVRIRGDTPTNVIFPKAYTYHRMCVSKSSGIPSKKRRVHTTSQIVIWKADICIDDKIDGEKKYSVDSYELHRI